VSDKFLIELQRDSAYKVIVITITAAFSGYTVLAAGHKIGSSVTIR
jgi:hypothetical protein